MCSQRFLWAWMLFSIACHDGVLLSWSFMGTRRAARKIVVSGNQSRLPSALSAWLRKPYYLEEEEMERERSLYLSPNLSLIDPPVRPQTQKIVVLGATGRVGRLVVKHLMEMQSIDMEIVAFCRSKNRAFDILKRDEGMGAKVGIRRQGQRGPKLTIVEEDLVPPEVVYGFEDTYEEKALQAAESAAAFFGESSIDKYNDQECKPPPYEELEQQITKSCTAIISCVDTPRRTNPWTDLLVRPFVRLLRRDASRWCKDRDHPYYVNYMSTLKALEVAEREQRRREDAVSVIEKIEEGRGGCGDEAPEPVQRIKFIRVSDLQVARKPWVPSTIFKNALDSMSVQYHDMTEQILFDSQYIDTIVVRAGQLNNRERNATDVSLVVETSGKVPSHGVASCADIADFVVSAAVTKEVGTKAVIPDTSDSWWQQQKTRQSKKPIHYTVALRWGNATKEGHPKAQECINAVLEKERRQAKRRQAKERKDGKPVKQVRRLKSYGIFVVLPVYTFLALFVKRNIWIHLPGRELITAFAKIYIDLLVEIFQRFCRSIIPFVRQVSQYLPKLLKEPTKSYISF